MTSPGTPNGGTSTPSPPGSRKKKENTTTPDPTTRWRNNAQHSESRKSSSCKTTPTESPNTAGAGATGGIIGGIIAAIVGIAVIATVVMICKQQRKNQTLNDDEDLEGPPAYKPPPPSVKLQASDTVSKNKESETEESVALKPVSFESPAWAAAYPETTQPLYQEVTVDEGLGHTEDPPNTEDDYLEQINPIYNDLSYPASDRYQDDKGFVMSRAMYV